MNRSFLIESGHAALLAVPNIDTDIIIPQTELVTTSRRGLGQGLFARWRYLEGRVPDPAFVLNQPRHRHASFLIAADNFGCGSSREHAAWALADFGIRAIVAPGFGEIFQRNCVRNGILPARVSKDGYTRLAEAAQLAGGGLRLSIDLHHQRINCAQFSLTFDIEPDDAARLLRGTDEIAETLAHAGAIARFAAADRTHRPWVYEPGWEQDEACVADALAQEAT
ncbi:3-isopropylmalate dehydratase small subunit [Janthinobacterium sp. RT4P48]|uniref:3-isopropylmalate dehydratase small subunit n=1 Tax=Janthinobacterium sp. RT4P48 TaxID=3424188 RepID=UPI003F21DA6F